MDLKVKVTVIGAGYVGLVTGVCFAEVGYPVVILENNSEKLAKLQRGESPIYEPGIEELITRNIGHERLSFTNSVAVGIKDADIIFIAVGTPENEDGSADLQYVEQAAREIAAQLDREAIVVVKSTVPVGSCDRVEAAIQAVLDKRQAGFKVEVISNPEFLKEGSAIGDFLKPDRIICGTNGTGSHSFLTRLYAPFVRDDPGKLVFMKRRSSELTKYASNSMLATRISFMNELARLCDQVEADVNEVRIGMGKDSRIGKSFLYPGPGYGGSCFPKDVKALLKTASEHHLDLAVVGATEAANARQIDYVMAKILSHFEGDLVGKTLTLWGLSFKPGTDDIREAPSLKLAKKLLESGAVLKVTDPQAMDNFKRALGEDAVEVTYCTEPYDALSGSDALVLMTEWKQYQKPSWDKVSSLLKSPVVFDLRNQYAIDMVEMPQFSYYGVGTGADRATGSVSSQAASTSASAGAKSGELS